MPNPKMPAPTQINGRLYFERHAWENHKRLILGLPPLDRDPKAPIVLVPAGQAAKELGRSRRTLDRRIRDAQRTAAKTTEAA